MRSAKSPTVSSVSRVIKKVEAFEKTGSCFDEKEPFIIEIADTPQKREKAFRLAYEVYLQKGYIAENSEEILTGALDHLPDTTVLVAYDRSKQVVATVTLNFEKHCAMPCREIFEKELHQLRVTKNQISEVTRLAIKNDCRDSALLLMKIFHAILIYTYKVKKNKSVVVEVNPSHATFYQKLLGFNKISEEVACNRVNGAPAVLLHLKLVELNQALEDSYVGKDSSFYKRIVASSFSIDEAKLLEQKFRDQDQSPNSLKVLLVKLFSPKERVHEFCLA